MADKSSSFSQSDTPAYQGAWQRQAPTIIGGFVLYTLLYTIIYSIFYDTPSILGFPPPDPKYCPDTGNDKPTRCARSDLFAFQITCSVPITLTSFLGLYAWYKYAHAVPQNPAGRLYTVLPIAEKITAVNFTFQLWDFVVSLFIPEHRTALMLTHHLLAASVSGSALSGGIVGYYAIVFLGLIELSSVGLAWIDLSTFFPPSDKSSLFALFVQNVAGPLFVLPFVYYRVIMWWPCSYKLWTDVHHVVTSGQASKLRPGYNWVLYLLCTINLPLGLLQLYWLRTIIEEVQKVLFSSDMQQIAA
jgi:TLC domain